MSDSVLFSPFKVRGLTLRNRVVVAPMQQYSGARGFPTDWHMVNAGRFAMGGAGLVIMESTKVDRRGCGCTGDLGLWDDGFIEPLARIARFIQDCGSAAGIQLGHTGRRARAKKPWEGDGPLTDPSCVDDWDDWRPVAPSPIAYAPNWPVPHALSNAEVKEQVKLWGTSARRADAAGFDVIEIHGGHGYLVHQFLSSLTNQRDDEYGGSLANRMRFAVEVAEEVRRNWPDHKPLFVRLSIEDGNGWDFEHSAQLVGALKAVGVDVIDCSTGGISADKGNLYRANELGYQVPYAARLRTECDILTMAVGLIVHGDQAESILRDGGADLIALARELLYNPNWPIDAAQKLGVDPDFSIAQIQSGIWLARRSRRGFGSQPSTWQAGVDGR
jgi:2,4-dienoyl-CoA reductase-like NADH-dependent reductase (Old Yellow Enzyme family)